MTGAIVGARFRDELGGNETRRQVSIGSRAVFVFLARARGERTNRAWASGSAPTTEYTIRIGSTKAAHAIRGIQRRAKSLLLICDIASRAREVRLAIRTLEAHTVVVNARTVATAVVTIVETRLVSGAGSAASTTLNPRGRAGTASIVCVANTIAAAVLERDASNGMTNTSARNSVALLIGNTCTGTESSRIVVQWVSLIFDHRDLDEAIKGIADSSSRVAEPSILRINNANIILAHLARGTSKTSRTGGRSDNASLTDVSTGLRLVSVVHGELETIAIRVSEIKERQVPHYLGTERLDPGPR
jgi:hypothetical protein